jgi:hypothetical protein
MIRSVVSESTYVTNYQSCPRIGIYKNDKTDATRQVGHLIATQ